jgi:hypothetical protein
MTLWQPISNQYADQKERFESLMKELYDCDYVNGVCTTHTGQRATVPRQGFDYDKAKRIVATRAKNAAKSKSRGTKSRPEQSGLLK